VINACSKVGNAAGAAQWLDSMLRAGVKANVQSYSSVISALLALVMYAAQSGG